MSLIDLAKLLYFFSVIVWLLPPFKQYKGRYFLFFLILAVIDPITFSYSFITKSTLPSQVFILFNYFLVLSLITKNMIKKSWLLFLLLTLVMFVPTIFQFDRIQNLGVVILLQSTIAFIILKNFITHYIATRSISVFHSVFLFYLFTIILKYLNILVGYADATAFFFLTSIAQIVFGLFFSVHRENKSGLTV